MGDISRAVWGVGLAAFAASAIGCVPIAAVPASERGIVRDAFPGLDPGGKSQSGLHFEVRAYASQSAADVSALAERLYERIMQDTGLYSFMSPGLYSIVIYRDKEEFLAKTGLPSWSGGAAVGNAIYSYEGPHLATVLAHEMSHLIFHEFMGPRAESRWVDEGLAVYEETKPLLEGVGQAAPQSVLEPMPFAELIRLAPLQETPRTVNNWYAQAASVVRFLIERGGRVGFSQFLRALREGRPADEALRLGWPGLWGSLAELESAWRRGG